MIRLTATLLFSIALTLSIAGRDLDQPEGTTLDVARAQTDLTDPTPGRLALEDEKGAIQRALAATSAFTPVSSAEATPAADPSPSVDVAPMRIAVVNANRVNLRAGPSTANRVLDQVVRGQELEVLSSTDNGWSEVRILETDKRAFIFDRFLTPQG